MRSTPIKHVAVFASGYGSNLAHIHSECVAGRLPSVKLSLVVSNNSTSGALEYARKHGIPSEHVSLLRSMNDERRYATDILQVLRSYRIDIIVLAGYLKKLPERIVEEYANRILNVHPALLPSFGGPSMYGRRVHEAVLARGCKVSGATVHLVTSEYDAGPIVLQDCCPVHDNDSPETLERRVRDVELEIYPRAIELVASGSVTIVNGRVQIKQ